MVDKWSQYEQERKEQEIKWTITGGCKIKIIEFMSLSSPLVAVKVLKCDGIETKEP